MKADTPQKRSIPVAKLLYRFATGLHMDGQRRHNPRTGHVLPHYRDYFWNRYTRTRRAMVRHSVLWTTVLIVYGLTVAYAVTVYCLFAMVPFIVAWIVSKFTKHTTMRVNTVTSDGIPQSYRTLRPKYSRRVKRVASWRFKIHPPTDAPIPGDWERPILAQLSEDGVGDVRTLRRPLTPPQDLDDLLKEQGPQAGREATHKRNAKRRLG